MKYCLSSQNEISVTALVVSSCPVVFVNQLTENPLLLSVSRSLGIVVGIISLIIIIG
jgi:hypothetical protein